MTGNDKRYDENFKKMIVELYHSGSSVSDLEREYGVTKVTIYKWIKEYSEIEIDENTTVTKKGFIHIRGKINSQSIDNFITENKDKYNIKTMCKIFGLPRNTYYDRINKKPSKRSLKKKMFKDLIMNIYI